MEEFLQVVLEAVAAFAEAVAGWVGFDPSGDRRRADWKRRRKRLPWGRRKGKKS